MSEPTGAMRVECPSCHRSVEAADEDGMVDALQAHLVEQHELEIPRERVRENVAAQLRGVDGYNARPISGA